jgi:hypothetical protein
MTKKKALHSFVRNYRIQEITILSSSCLWLEKKYPTLFSKHNKRELYIKKLTYTHISCYYICISRVSNRILVTERSFRCTQKGDISKNNTLAFFIII